MKLLEFCAAGDIIQVKEFYEKHKRVDLKDYDKRTALHVAAAAGCLDVCKFLVLK